MSHELGDDGRVQLRIPVGTSAPFGRRVVLAVLAASRSNGRSQDPFYVFHACLSRCDEANPSFAPIVVRAESLVWDEAAQSGTVMLSADWVAIHGCADWSCTGRQETRVEVRFDPGRGELVLSSTRAPEMPSTLEEF